MDQTSLYIITLLTGILLGIGVGSRLTTGAIRFQDRYRDPVYVGTQRRESGFSTFLAAVIFVVLLLALIGLDNWNKENTLMEPPGIEQKA